MGARFFLSRGAFSDTDALTQFDFDLPEGSQIFADKAYTYYLVEDLLDETDLQLAPDRKKNSKRPMPPWLHFSFDSIAIRWKRQAV